MPSRLRSQFEDTCARFALGFVVRLAGLPPDRPTAERQVRSSIVSGLIIRAIPQGALEVADARTQAFCNFRDTLCAEDQRYEGEDEEDLSNAYS